MVLVNIRKIFEYFERERSVLSLDVTGQTNPSSLRLQTSICGSTFAQTIRA